MSLRSSAYSWGSVAKLLHWMMACGVLAAIACGIAMGWFLDSNIGLKFRVYQIHKSLGFLLLCLAIVRLGWRLSADETPALPDGMKPHERLLAEAVHVALYICLIAQPLLGWAGASASPLNIPTVVFGWFTLPRLIAANAKAEAWLNGTHLVVGWLMTGIIGLHIAGALYHHVFLKDGTLNRMLPHLRQHRKGSMR